MLYHRMIHQVSSQRQIEIRTKIVRYAQEKGISSAAREFSCARATVRKWVRRFKSLGHGGLLNRSCAPQNIPHKTNEETREKIIEARRKAPCYGARRLKQSFSLLASEGAIYRILKEEGLIQKYRKKYHKKRDLRAIKARYRALTHVQVDVKYLRDIPHYWPQMEKHKLPRFQYTLRDAKSGFMFLGYAKEYSELHSTLFISRYLEHLKTVGIDLTTVVVQTDNGGEFGAAKRDLHAPGFVQTIREKYRSHHRFIPPRMCNANADVESAHATIEYELFDLEDFGSQGEFFKKVNAYQLFYDLQRPISTKQGKTLFQIILEDYPDISPEVMFCPVANLDQMVRFPSQCPPGGKYVPALPVQGNRADALNDSH